MEPLNDICPTLQTDVINVENVECETPSPVTSCAGSDCSISAGKAIATTEAEVEERNDVMLRLMGHLIPVSTGPEEGSASETDSSIVSSASTLKRRLHNLPAASDAVKLADRVAALNRRIRKERDLYLHLQGLNNRIEEKDEGELSTTDSSKTVNSTSNRHRQGQFSKARARRRERLSSGSQAQMSSDLQLWSPGLSSPEPLTLRDIREDLTEEIEMEELSSPIKNRYCFENDAMLDLMRENAVTGTSNSEIIQQCGMPDEMTSSCLNASQFSVDHNFCPVVSDRENSTALIDVPPDGRGGISSSEFNYANYVKDGLTSCNLTTEAENARAPATTSSTASSTGVDYRYVTRKRTPMKFGGYRPSAGLIIRNLSSDSESDAISDRIIQEGLQGQKYRWGNGASLETNDTEEREHRNSDFVLRNCTVVDSRHFFEESNPSRRIGTRSELQTPEEADWKPRSPDERSRNLDDKTGNVVKRKTSVDGNAGHFYNSQFIEESVADSFSKENDAHISRNYDKNSAQYVGSSSNTETLILREEACSPSHDPEAVNLSTFNSNAEVPGTTNHQSAPLSVRCFSGSEGGPEELRNLSQNHDHDGWLFGQELVAIDDNSADMRSNAHQKIPPLEIGGCNYSQSNFLTSSKIREDETARSSLDVNALIQALSDVSLKQKNSTNSTNRPIVKLKSPLGCGNRFSESSGPRSSEYTPALGGSRQSLTSLEVSETHSIKIAKGESTARRQATVLLKSDEQIARSASRTGEFLEKLSTPPPNIKKSPIVRSMPRRDLPLEVDSSRGESFIPVIAKVDRTNIVCAKHPLRIKSIGKLISPRKYQNTEFKGEIADPLTSRTEVSQSSNGSRKSFRSLKSVKPVTKTHGKKIDGSQAKTDNACPPAPLSGRRILKPLNLVPKIQADSLSSMTRKINYRKKTANDSSEIINSQFAAGSERTVTPISSRNFSRRSPLPRTNRTELPIPRFAQRPEDPIVQAQLCTVDDTEVLNSRRTSGKPFDDTSRPSTLRDHKLTGNTIKGQKHSSVSSEKSSVTSGNAVYLIRSERLSMSSGDYEGNVSWSPSPRDEDLTENDNTYDLEDKLCDHEGPVSVGSRKMSVATDLGPQDMRLSNFATNLRANSFKNCVHLNNLQDGREVTLPCGSARCQEDCLRGKELFNRLPNEISGSLTRHTSIGTHVAENLHSTKEIPSTIEDLRKNIQENNDRWINGFKNDDGSVNGLPGSTVDRVSSTGSPLQYEKSQYQNLLSSQAKIPRKISLVGSDGCHSQLPPQKSAESTESNSHSKNCVSGKIEPAKSDNKCLSPLYGNIRTASVYDSEPGQLDSQSSSLIHSSADHSHQNTYRSVAECIEPSSILRFDETLGHEVSRRDSTLKMTESSAIELRNSGERQTVRLCDIRVISNIKKETIAQKDSPKAPFSVQPSDYTSDTDEHDRKTLNLGYTDAKRNSADTVPNLECDSTLNRTLEYSQSKLKNPRHSDEDCEQNEEKDQGSQFANNLEEHESSKYERFSASGIGICEKIGSPSSTRSAKPQITTQHYKDGIISSPVSTKSFLSMSKLNSASADSKWDVAVVTGPNSVKKSQDRFPFTISESASRKTSKFKVAADVSLDKLIQNQSAHAEHSILERSGDQENESTYRADENKKEITPFLKEFSSKISNDSPDNWDAQVPFIGLNYMSYGCREEPRTLMPSVKEMVKKLSAKLRYTRTKRCQDPEETTVNILYRNKKCRYESGEGSSSAASMYQSQLLDTSKKLIPSLVRRSNDGSRASSGKAIRPKRNHECISMSMQHSPRKGCDQDDLWIQEFDSDAEFDDQASTAAVAYCQTPNDLNTESMPRTSSPVNDRYSMFLARRKLPRVTNEADHNEQSRMSSVINSCEDEDIENVNCKSPGDIDGRFIEVQEMGLESPKTPANSFNDDTNEFENYDSGAKSGCCCFRIHHFFVTSKKRKRLRNTARNLSPY